MPSTIQFRPPSTLTGYHLGYSSQFASKTDQRVSYCTYVPKAYSNTPKESLGLTVVIHGSDRNSQALRDYFSGYAEETNSIVLAPLFPCGLVDPDDTDNYKYVRFRGIRFDNILMDIVDEVSALYGIDGSNFNLFGFSGGAQFVHRFMLIHPHCLNSVVIAAPGTVTLIDDSKDWWMGTAGLENDFSFTLDRSALERINIHLCVGSEDTAPLTNAMRGPGDERQAESLNFSGANRNERHDALLDNYRANNLNVSSARLAGKGHDCFSACDEAIRFFSAHS